MLEDQATMNELHEKAHTMEKLKFDLQQKEEKELMKNKVKRLNYVSNTTGKKGAKVDKNKSAEESEDYSNLKSNYAKRQIYEKQRNFREFQKNEVRRQMREQLKFVEQAEKLMNLQDDGEISQRTSEILATEKDTSSRESLNKKLRRFSELALLKRLDSEVLQLDNIEKLVVDQNRNSFLDQMKSKSKDSKGQPADSSFEEDDLFSHLEAYELATSEPADANEPPSGTV